MRHHNDLRRDPQLEKNMKDLATIGKRSSHHHKKRLTMNIYMHHFATEKCFFRREQGRKMKLAQYINKSTRRTCLVEE